VFDPDTLAEDYQTAYSNVVNIALNTSGSIEEEHTVPLPVNYIEPKPVCQCPDMGE